MGSLWVFPVTPVSSCTPAACISIFLLLNEPLPQRASSPLLQTHPWPHPSLAQHWWLSLGHKSQLCSHVLPVLSGSPWQRLEPSISRALQRESSHLLQPFGYAS